MASAMDPFSTSHSVGAGGSGSKAGDFGGAIVGRGGGSQQQQQQKPIEDLLDDEDELEDETLAERLAALAEMFPESVRRATTAAASGSVRLACWGAQQTSNLLWVVATTGLIAALPLVIERERLGAEEAEQEHERKMMLGPAGGGGTAAAAASFAHA